MRAATQPHPGRLKLVAMLRDAVEELALEDEDVAYASPGESAREQALARKPLPRGTGDAPARARARSAGAIAGRGRM
jgi:hypothetical protein